MMEIVPVPFHGDTIFTVDADGKPDIILKPAVENLGIDYWTQVEKLRRRSWACTSQRLVQLPGDAQARQMVTCDVRTFLMLLATIDEKRVPEDVRPKLIEYQAEVADAIESYWFRGGAINPRASREQLGEIVDLAERRIRMLSAAAGIVDPHWLEAKTRHELARGLGEEPEVDPATAPLTVGEYLEKEREIKGAELRKLSPKLGKAIKKLYRAMHGKDPLPVPRFIDGATRPVAGYTERDRPLFDAAWLAHVESVGSNVIDMPGSAS